MTNEQIAEIAEGLVVTRYYVPTPDGLNTVHPDRLSVTAPCGECLLDVSMSGDSPLRPFLSAKESRPWFYTGSPFGAEILAFARHCGLAVRDYLERNGK